MKNYDLSLVCKRILRRVTILFVLSLFVMPCNGAPRKVYMTYILHGNMNYDRYVRPTIWKNFPVIYNNLMDFMDQHPDFRGQLQFSGQTYGSLLQAAPYVIEHAKKIRQRGQLNFTGTFYSEPVNVNMDGETNYRCAWLGTKIIESAVGETDGFYLQERAYHPQLPWILRHSNVSWMPVITGDDAWRPFRLKGMDGTSSVCVPITRGNFLDKVRKAPVNSLIAIEEDYEFPQTFVNAYNKVESYNRSQQEVTVEWITVKDYIQKFGVDKERYVDHSAKARHRENGTYSRWTADPLDIQIQHLTNHAMADMRSAKMVVAIARHLFDVNLDEDFASSGYQLHWEPLAWNIERAELYPDIEPQFLSRHGCVTLLSKAEHQLLWAVNSDSKGWYPLYEKRRERMNALRNCSDICHYIINKGMKVLAEQCNVNAQGMDKCFVLLNCESARKKTISIECAEPLDFVDLSNNLPLCSSVNRDGNHYTMYVEVPMPQYGYKIIGARHSSKCDDVNWCNGTTISNNHLCLSAEGEKVVLSGRGMRTEIFLDTFQIKALAEMNMGKGDDTWRQAKAYGGQRISVSTDGLYPQLRIEWQPDWLVHLQQTFTLKRDHVICDMHFEFPHPTLVRKEGAVTHSTFNPEGLNLIVKTGTGGKVGYDIPFGISEYSLEGLSYFCPLTSLWLQCGNHEGMLISPQTGEQAFSANLTNGTMKVYLGASTTSGPISAVNLAFRDKTNVSQEEAWYAEPFQGGYNHRVVFMPYKGTWQDCHLPQMLRWLSQPVYCREIIHAGYGSLPAEGSFLQVDVPNVDITVVDDEGQGIFIRCNEREGRKTDAVIILDKKKYKISLPPFGIVSQYL